MAQQLDEQKVALVDQVNVNVSEHVEHVDRKPADCKGGHQERNQAKDLPLPGSVDAHLVLRPVARGNAFLQFDSDAEIRNKDSRQRKNISDQQGAVRVSPSFFLLAQPELFADGEAFLLELDMVGVRHRWSHQATRRQPDSSEDVGTGRHRGPLLQRVNSCIISATK